MKVMGNICIFTSPESFRWLFWPFWEFIFNLTLNLMLWPWPWPINIYCDLSRSRHQKIWKWVSNLLRNINIESIFKYQRHVTSTMLLHSISTSHQLYVCSPFQPHISILHLLKKVGNNKAICSSICSHTKIHGQPVVYSEFDERN